MTPKCNSGIGIRTIPFDPKKNPATRPSYAAYEVQLLDDAGKPPNNKSSGSLYRYVAPSANPVKPAPEWNEIDIECVGPRIKITINGQKIIDVDQSKIDEIKNKPLKGYVCLQNHGGRIEFRNVRIRELGGDKK
jgi:3-keto-disaccharide hydrolase